MSRRPFRGFKPLRQVAADNRRKREERARGLLAELRKQLRAQLAPVDTRPVEHRDPEDMN